MDRILLKLHEKYVHIIYIYIFVIYIRWNYEENIIITNSLFSISFVYSVEFYVSKAKSMRFMVFIPFQISEQMIKRIYKSFIIGTLYMHVGKTYLEET